MPPERVTQERNDRTWWLFRISWYVTVALAITSLLVALFFFSRIWQGYATNIAAGSSIFMAFVIIAVVLLLGAGICRFQARLEGQNLEIKLAIRQLSEELDELKTRLKAEAGNGPQGRGAGQE
jgi:hypothetical protein